jgi:hypothetical protein
VSEAESYETVLVLKSIVCPALTLVYPSPELEELVERKECALWTLLHGNSLPLPSPLHDRSDGSVCWRNSPKNDLRNIEARQKTPRLNAHKIFKYHCI